MMNIQTSILLLKDLKNEVWAPRCQHINKHKFNKKQNNLLEGRNTNVETRKQIVDKSMVIEGEKTVRWKLMVGEGKK